ncbi:tryptophan synthase subunit alpha [Dactylosporangium siamense]|uniref:Tryptophan synthase alpha chain n=1 Tax=Dactylosporangium siamense TaxID=685454 RepID=A0A919UA85_9ACTN|nr:tryptophan synthase subunit alpha [Dactylosporangium siamense]GIG43378.1 tryptophan synthase alpha chain [Dactylosporangium siamense]
MKLPSDHKILMPYLTGGAVADWTDHLRALIDAGADAIEIGLPFSDPTLDGATIQEATHAALTRGATLRGILTRVSEVAGTVPLVASTYANLVVRDRDFCGNLRDAGFDGLIVPDLPLEECAEFENQDLDLVLLASPATTDERLDEIARRSRGFVYAVTVMGTTGERETLAASAADLARRLTNRCELPVLLGFGISTPAQAAQAAQLADGVVIGAAIMRRVLDGAGPAELGAYLRSIREAMDEG